jgi:hypothetical protein
MFYTGGPVALSSDGSFLACACHDQVKVVDVASGAVTSSFEGDSEPITAIVVAPDGSSLFAASRSRQVKLWNLASGACTRSWKVQSIHTHASSTNRVFDAHDLCIVQLQIHMQLPIRPLTSSCACTYSSGFVHMDTNTHFPSSNAHICASCLCNRMCICRHYVGLSFDDMYTHMHAPCKLTHMRMLMHLQRHLHTLCKLMHLLVFIDSHTHTVCSYDMHGHTLCGLAHMICIFTYTV